MIPVTCYTNCDTVELLLNGRSLGLKGFQFPRTGMVSKWANMPARARALRTTADLHLIGWDVFYQAGSLKAVGIKECEIIRTIEITTTGAAAAIRLTTDRTTITTRCDDVSHVTVEIVDAQGRMVPTRDNCITFAVDGLGKILGVHNGGPDSHESFQPASGVQRARTGVNGRPGALRLSASAGSLAAAEISVTANAG